ncbi:MAG: hypothetical protein IKC69_02205 [Clostridia bacterium]|nr:hypothetical protein [Clostridia bacterium]
MKRALLFGFCLLLAASCFSCRQEVDEKANRETLPPLTEPWETEIPWKDWVDDSYPYDLNEYLTLPPHEGVVAVFDDSGVCTDEELEEATLQIRLSLAKFEKKDGPAEKTDRVTVSYEVVLEGQLLEDKSAEALEIVLGLDGYDGEKAALARALEGAEVGELCWADYRYPESPLYGSLAGKTVVVKGTVKKIEKAVLAEMDEAFVHSLDGFEESSVEDFFDSVRRDVVEEKKRRKVNAVWAAFCEKVTVHRYPEEELEKYREEFADYYLSLAEAMEMEQEEFLEEYAGMTPEEFEEEKELYATEMVKNDMIFTQLIRTLSVTVSQEEYNRGAREYYEAEMSEFKSFEDFEAYYTREQILENLVRDKALLSVVEKAVCDKQE